MLDSVLEFDEPSEKDLAEFVSKYQEFKKQLTAIDKKMTENRNKQNLLHGKIEVNVNHKSLKAFKHGLDSPDMGDGRTSLGGRKHYQSIWDLEKEYEKIYDDWRTKLGEFNQLRFGDHQYLNFIYEQQLKDSENV